LSIGVLDEFENYPVKDFSDDFKGTYDYWVELLECIKNR
jgi:hypothetical protein